MKEVMAKHMNAKISAQKARLVVNQVRGVGAEKALELLKFSAKKAATIVKKVLESAIANAEYNEGMDIDDLKVSSAYVDESMTMKRIRPRAKGRADRIFKRSCHVVIKVAEA